MGRRKIFSDDHDREHIMGVQAVAKACGRMGERLTTDMGLQRALARVRRELAGGKGE